jgi:uncharacterized damage-inducible protein DinB
MSKPEAWLLGRVEGCSDALMPVAHSLVQARREIATLQNEVSEADCLVTPGGAASVGFHIAHICGSLDRLFSYARGEQLNPAQLDSLHRETQSGAEVDKDELFTAALNRIDVCLDLLRDLPDHLLFQSRPVGRDKLPSTVLGLVFHAAEHTTMHVGQIRTTVKIIRGLDLATE